MNVFIFNPDKASHICKVLSVLQLIIVLLSGEYLTEYIKPEWPDWVFILFPLNESHIFIVLS
jgi:hypothetical protein